MGELINIENNKPSPVGRPYKYKTIEEFQGRWIDYLKDEKTTAPRITQFCIYAGISADTFDAYKERSEFVEPIKNMLAVCEDHLVSLLLDNNRKNIIGPIFALKNCYNWKDKVETENNTKITLDINLPDNVKKLSK